MANLTATEKKQLLKLFKNSNCIIQSTIKTSGIKQETFVNFCKENNVNAFGGRGVISFKRDGDSEFLTIEEIKQMLT